MSLKTRVVKLESTILAKREPIHTAIIEAHHAGIVFSIDKVRKELNKGKKDDPVRTWMSKLPESFLLQT